VRESRKNCMKEQQTLVARWKKIWLSALIVFAVLFAWRVTQLQLVEAKDYERLAEANRIWRLVQRAPRGEIRDRNGTLIAGNTLQYLWEYEENSQRRERVISSQEE